jgi:hypothetical protein
MRTLRFAPLLTCLALAACGGASHPAPARSHSSPTTSTAAATPTTTANNPGSATGPEGMPLEAGPTLAPASTTSPSRAIDGVRCAPVEQVAYHIHAHLQVYVNGLPAALPGGIGILDPVVEQSAYGPFYTTAGGCFYWLHTHASDGVIHVESPTPRVYTLGDFFDEWRQPLGSRVVAGAHGPVTAFVNGRPWRRSPRSIPLVPHAAIQLAVGDPVPPFHGVSWSGTSL